MIKNQDVKIERLVLSIATNQFTVPLPSGKDVIRMVNAHDALVNALHEYRAQHDVLWRQGEVGRTTECPCGRCIHARAALAKVNAPKQGFI